MDINWTYLAYIVIGIFAISGFFKGWWKEAITTFFLIFLVFLWRFPPLAKLYIDLINFILVIVVNILPDNIRAIWRDFLETNLGISTVDGVIRLDAANGGTWLVILLLFIGLAIFISRAVLPSTFRVGLKSIYRPDFKASLLGGLLGAFNGFLTISLIVGYLSGADLPGASARATPGAPAAGGSLQAVAVPNFTLTESFVSWIFVALALLVLVAAISNRIAVRRDKEGYTKMDITEPFGYDEIEVTVK
ncbi:MAG: hypothetical protein HYR94_13080 [Chloroflexi bacterium]|nr:hypothetical protein [Chloroflexota bacterium]